MRILETAGLAIGLTLGAMMVGTWIDYAGAQAPAAPNALRVYGPDVPALQKGIGYWNGVAGREVMRFEEGNPEVEGDPRTVLVTLGILKDGMLGVAAGDVGKVPTQITIAPAALTDWRVYAHELGHALGLDDYNTHGLFGPGVVDATYEGVMSYEVGTNPDKSDDKALLRGSWLFDDVSIGTAAVLERG